MKLYIVGFSGAGKSTLAQALAQSWQIDYLDIDTLCEQECGLSIADYVMRNGWESFRELESRVLHDTQKDKTSPQYPADESELYSKGQDRYQSIIACGGGIVESKRNRDFLKKQRLIWLNPPWKTILARIRQNPSHFCAGKSDAELYQSYRHRCTLYKQILN